MSVRLDFPPHSLWESRTGSGTPVALLHGLSGSSRWWSRNIVALSERHTVVAVDLVGFGKNRRFSGLPLLLPAFSEVTALLARWLETFDEPVHLIGHSMGGQIAIELAAERPDLVRSLILVNAAGMPFRFDLRPHVRAVPKPPYGGAGIARVLVPDFLRAGPASVAVASARVMLGDMRERMHAIRAPALLVWGENDPLVPLTYGKAMQQEIAGSRLAVIAGAAHVAMWDQPEEFNRIALRFLAEVESGAELAETERQFGWGIAGWTLVQTGVQAGLQTADQTGTPAGGTTSTLASGLAHRQAGRRRDIVLVHGMGLSSAYLEPLASALFARGWNPIAPDLPGFGESENAAAAGPEQHAAWLAEWAGRMGIRDAVWLGHSIGCNIVKQLGRMRPDLVRKAVMVGPLWTRRRFPTLSIFSLLVLDACREPLRLFLHVLPAYWRAGLARWLATWWRFAPDVSCVVPAGLCLAGENDPIPDRTCLQIISVPGAHACVYSHPTELVEAMERAGVTRD